MQIVAACKNDFQIRARRQQLSRNLRPGPSRHDNVRQKQVDTSIVVEPNFRSLLRIAGLKNLKTFPFENSGSQLPHVLIVFNHPMWDLYSVGADLHVQLVNGFLRENHEWIHAIELNGLRNWGENRLALRLAEQWGIVPISGGDRHGLEPNANINLTNAQCFDQFVHEIRNEELSKILFMAQYAQPLKHRILQSAVDAVNYYPDFPQGAQRWDQRVYHPDAHGVLQPLAAMWPDGSAPRAMRWGVALVLLMGRGVFSGSLRLAWSEAHELAQALEERESPSDAYSGLAPYGRKQRPGAGAQPVKP